MACFKSFIDILDEVKDKLYTYPPHISFIVIDVIFSRFDCKILFKMIQMMRNKKDLITKYKQFLLFSAYYCYEYEF